MPISKAPIVLAAGFALALPALGTVKTVTIDRRLPVNQYCPIDNVDFDLTFVADSPYARISFSVLNQSPSGTFLATRLDNIAVIDKAGYDAHHVAPLNFSACYASPGDPNSPALDFNAAGTFERYLSTFDTSAGANGWDLNQYASYHGGGGAPRNVVNGSDVSGGCLQMGAIGSGAVKVSTNRIVSGLTVGTEYIVTGWWSTADTSRPLTVVIDTDPCVDRDGDGVVDCADCDDRNPNRKPGATEACDGVDNDCDGVVDESTPCAVACDPPQLVGTDTRITNNPSARALARWNGTDFGLFYEDSVNTGTPDVFFARATAAGSEIGTEKAIGSSSFNDVSPRAVWTGSDYGVVWMRGSEVRFQRFTRTGAMIGASMVLGSGASPDVAWTGTEFGVVWSGGQSLFVQLLSPEGATLLPSPAQFLTSGFPAPPTAGRPRIAWNGSAYGVVWVENTFIIKFRVVPPLAVASGTPVALVPAGVNTSRPEIAAGGSTWGVVWDDRRDGPDPEIYFARVGADGVKLGGDVRITNATAQSFTPSIAWSGAEWGIAWDDLRSGDEEIWFARVGSDGVKLGTDFRVTDSVGVSREPSIAWAGGKFGVAWTDFRDATNGEIYFASIGCDCADLDADGFSSCVDCDDGNSAVYPGATQACTGITNDCNNPVWPSPLGVTDDDGDGVAPCEGDCDDTHASVYAGAPQICDGLNNNCTGVTWPFLMGTNEADNDGDTYSTCAGDCSDVSPFVWGTPGEVRAVAMNHDKANGLTTVVWQAPATPGGQSVTYDTIRSSSPVDFTAGATCVGSNGTVFPTDAATPALGSAFYYLIRAENQCPGAAGMGPLGNDSAGTPRTARTCP